jgi:4-amino-4-deoxy-L-arabinose transferase-like glycosyltransferase
MTETIKSEAKTTRVRSTNKQSLFVVIGVTALLCVFFLQLATATWRNSITWDEDDHIYAGYMSVKHGDFGLNPEHPPLVKMLAALPLLPLHLKELPLQGRSFKMEAFLNGKDFIFHNTVGHDAILFRARIAATLLTLLLALLVFAAAREMFGIGAAFIALGLMAFDPNVLAHGAVVGTDIGLSCFMFASIYSFYRYVKAPSVGRLIVVGIAGGLALAAKHTGILLLPMLVLLAAYEIWRRGGEAEGIGALSKGKRTARLALAIVCMSAIAIVVLWAFYGFRYQAREAGLPLNPPMATYLSHLSRPREAHILAAVAKWHLFPESYIYGLADVRIMSDFYTSYIFGKVYPHGVWFYFPAAFVIKSTLAFLILLAIAIWVVATRRLPRWREITFLTIPPIFHLLTAMSAGMNIGLRHILPMYFFLYVLIGGAFTALIRKDRRWAYAVVALIAFQAISGARTYPAYMAYENELWGGPSNTYKYLSDSNADWGQQLKDTKKYLDQHGIKDCWFIYFAQGVVDFRDYGIPCRPLPTMDTLWVNEPIDAPPAIDGPVLISAGDLSGFEFGGGALNPYEQFRQLKPAAVIDYSVFLFNGHFEIPLAAAISHTQRARNLLESKQLPEALAEAQQAVALAPDSVEPNATLGDVLAAMQRQEEARQSYEKALMLAKTVQPDFQIGWVGRLQANLAK